MTKGKETKMSQNYEIRKSHGIGFNVYAVYPDGFTMFAGNFKTAEEANRYGLTRFGN